MTELLYVEAALGAVITWRTLVNANHMTAKTHHGIRLLNWMMSIGGLAMAASPLYGGFVAEVAGLAVIAVFVVCMFIGRRPGDKVLAP